MHLLQLRKSCSVEEFAIRDQIVIGTNNKVICEKAMLKNWNLQELHKNGMKYKSAAAGEEKILGGALNKIIPYLFCNLKKMATQIRMTKRKSATDVVHLSNLII